MESTATPPTNGTTALPRIPVICDQCRARAFAGDEPFAEIGDLLDFEPVPRKNRRVDGWTPQLQRAFIAALAVTGSTARAARSIGKFAAGVEQLRKARGGNSFARAWDAAMELYRERELIRLKGHLEQLADQHDEPGPATDSAGTTRLSHPAIDRAREEEGEERAEYLECILAVRGRLTRARRLFLFLIHDDPARRAAWEALVGPVDWAKAERREAQPDEPFNDDEPDPNERLETGLPQMSKPDMLLVAEAGLIPDMTGGYDALADMKAQVDAEREKMIAEGYTVGEDGRLNPPDPEAEAERERLKAEGWTEDSMGNLWSPEEPSTP